MYNIHVLKNLSEDFILGINFFQDAGLAFDPGNLEIYWTDRRFKLENHRTSKPCQADPRAYQQQDGHLERHDQKRL